MYFSQNNNETVIVMPIITKAGLPANKILKEEGVFLKQVQTKEEEDAIQIAILNLMPMKEDTELQLLRKLSCTDKNVQITFVKTDSHNFKNVSQEHLDNFYEDFDSIKTRKWDGLIITGAPIELINFEDVDYWKELEKIMEWSKQNVSSTLHICWGAQAGLYYHYGINKILLPEKKFGVFSHSIYDLKSPIVTNLEDGFMAPHSRHTTINKDDIERNDNLIITAYSNDAGVFLVENTSKSQIFVMGHLEYDVYTLDNEYKRDLSKGLDIQEPKNYYKNGVPFDSWSKNGNIFYSNWINNYLDKS